MRCPACGGLNTYVSDNYKPHAWGSCVYRRRRKCNDCGFKFYTVERVSDRDLRKAGAQKNE